MESVLKGSTMEERAQSLLETNIGSDCDFLVGSEENKVLFKANKIFLTKASPVFERMLYGGLQPSYPIEVPDIEPEVFHLMLKYMYGCKWTFESNEQAVSVCYGAHKYMLKELLDRCVEYLWPCCVDDVWIALQCASLYYLNDLKKASLQIVQVNSHEFFASRNFEHLGKSSLIDILQLDYMNVTSEIEIFESVNQWAIAQCTEKVQV
ncbi:BTB/POZ domain-containing protein 2-like isoform X2 [Periplaneta americana]|uniref:BTB/POZ domain-containing protein 2-like isoform X2 n=1 Tax=Periplaneta americana TaxID=6978 RepID=UPI0037E99D4C